VFSLLARAGKEQGNPSPEQGTGPDLGERSS
jgi:hypothetical protein